MSQQIAGAGTAPGPPVPDTLTAGQRERRQRIIRAATSLLDKSEYEKVQMRDVAEAAGVALGTVYRYFSSKEHLFGAARAQWGSSLQDVLQRKPLKGQTPNERLDDLMQRVLTAFERRPQFFRLVTMLESTPDPHARELAGQANDEVRSAFLQPLDGIDADRADTIVDIVNAVLWTLLRQWSQGFITMAEARKRMSRAIALLTIGPPRE
jgi:AcrR family transcriptional regulator